MPTPVPPVTPFTMPDARPQQDASTVNRLTGLLASDSPYLAAARQAGLRTAQSRGLLNTSIAAGTSEASAIAAAAPIASQDASQANQFNLANQESDNALRNSATVQGLSDQAAMARQISGQDSSMNLQALQEKAAMERQQSGQVSALTLQQLQEASALERQKSGEASSLVLGKLQEGGALTREQMQSNAQMSSSYLTAFSGLANDPNIPAAVRNTYIAEFQRILGNGQGLIQYLAGTPVAYPGGTTPAPTTGTQGLPTPVGAPVPVAPQPMPSYQGQPTTGTAPTSGGGTGFGGYRYGGLLA